MKEEKNAPFYTNILIVISYSQLETFNNVSWHFQVSEPLLLLLLFSTMRSYRLV